MTQSFDVNASGEVCRFSHGDTRTILNRLFDNYRIEGFPMPYTMEDFRKEVALEQLSRLTPEERLTGMSPKERVTGLSPKEILQALAPDEVSKLLVEIKRQNDTSDDTLDRDTNS